MYNYAVTGNRFLFTLQNILLIQKYNIKANTINVIYITKYSINTMYLNQTSLHSV